MTRTRFTLARIKRICICFIILILFLNCSAQAQYPFAKKFIPGVVFFKDSTQKKGLIKWNVHQDEKVKFRQEEGGDIVEYSPSDIFGFQVNDMLFSSLSNIEFYGDKFADWGNITVIKEIFGRLVGLGKIRTYLVSYYTFPAMGGTKVAFNIVFERHSADSTVYSAFPVMTMMGNKKFERAKEHLYTFFPGYPDIIEKIKAHRQEQSFNEVIDLVKEIR